MSELTTNRLNELLNEQADKELNSRLNKMLKEAEDISIRLTTAQDIEWGSYKIQKGSYIQSVLLAVNKAMFEALCETNRARYVNEWLKKVNKTLDASKNLQGGPL